MQLNDDISPTFIGSREQDNEALAFQKDLASARGKDSEVEMASLSESLQQKGMQAFSEPAPQPSIPKKEPLPTADGKTPENLPDGDGVTDMLPDAEGKLEPVVGGEIKSEDENLADMVANAPRIVGDIAAGLPKNFTAGGLRAAKEAVDAVIPGGLERADSALVDLGLGEYVETMNTFVANIENGGGTGDKIVQELAQFAVPFSGYMKMLGATTKMGVIPKALTADAMASFMNLDPHMERLSTVFAELGVQNELVSYLADQGGTDVENRFRNVMENQAIGGALGLGMYTMAKAFKGVWWTGKAMKKQIDDVGWDALSKVEKKKEAK